MKKISKITLTVILCLSLLLSSLSLTACSSDGEADGGAQADASATNTPTDAPTDTPTDAPNGGEGNESDDSIVILYENDVHCEIDGYSKLSAMKKELAESYGHVGVVSSGDFVQGGTIGAVSKGEYIVEIMNKVGYDAIALGNHEFDYLLPQLEALNELSNTEFISCNFSKIGENEPYFEPYRIVSYGDVEIAYIGITTPETLSSAYPSQFKGEDGEYIFSFNEATLCEILQANIDEVEAAGADYVIALSHYGYSENEDFANVTDLIENTEGLDAVLDAHTHSVIEGMTVKDKNGDDVLLSSTGTKFEHIGKLTIDENGMRSELIKTEDYEKTDSEIDAYISAIEESYAELGNRKIGESLVSMNTHDGDVRIARTREIALGNFCSDAYRIVTGADVGFVGGGAMRAPVEAGELTFNDIYSIFPFGNKVVTIEVTGQMLLDMLEMGVMNYPEEIGCFPHTSGLTFRVNTAIPSSVILDENGFFDGVEGEYRVYDVRILDSESGSYKSLDLDATYVLAGANYFLLDYGDGMAMFKGSKVIDTEIALDEEVLESYVVNYLDRVIGEEYSVPQGRLTFTEGFVAAAE